MTRADCKIILRQYVGNISHSLGLKHSDIKGWQSAVLNQWKFLSFHVNDKIGLNQDWVITLSQANDMFMFVRQKCALS